MSVCTHTNESYIHTYILRERGRELLTQCVWVCGGGGLQDEGQPMVLTRIGTSFMAQVKELEDF